MSTTIYTPTKSATPTKTLTSISRTAPGAPMKEQPFRDTRRSPVHSPVKAAGIRSEIFGESQFAQVVKVRPIKRKLDFSSQPQRQEKKVRVMPRVLTPSETSDLPCFPFEQYRSSLQAYCDGCGVSPWDMSPQQLARFES